MKRISPIQLSLLVVVAVASATPTKVKAGPVPLPDRNPERPMPAAVDFPHRWIAADAR